MITPPSSLRVRANGLDHRVLEWTADSSPELGRPEGAPRTVVLVHGFMDAAGGWDLVAPELARAGLRVLAPDMRGFGEGARVPEGAYYHFPDYVFDLADVVEALAPGEPIGVVGHSMGGTIATLYAGAFPERVARLVSIEGLGPPDNPFEAGPLRMRRWIDEVRAVRAREGKGSTFDRDEAVRRLSAFNPTVPASVLATRLPHLAAERDGAFAWRADPLHRTTAPVPFFAKLFVEYAKRVTCPVLFVSGGPAGFHVPDEDDRLAAFAHLTRLELDGAGHAPQWSRPADLARALVDFLAGTALAAPDLAT